MLQAPTALVNYMAARSPSAVTAELLSLVLPGSGTVLRYTTGTRPVTAPASDFPGSPLNGTGGPFTWTVGPRIDRIKIPSRKIGLDAAECPITLYPTPSDLIGSYTWQQYALAEELDAATIEVDRYHWSGDGFRTPLGAFIVVYGRIADIDIGRSVLTLNAKTLPYLLDQPMPRDLYQATCGFVFGGPLCGYDRVAGKNALGASTGIGAQAIAAQTGSTQAQVNTTFTPSPSTAYDRGTLIGTSGANNQVSRTISQLSGGVISLTRNLPFPVTTGDGFQLLPGCPHTTTYCNSPLNNLLRFGGQPYIPPPELSI